MIYNGEIRRRVSTAAETPAVEQKPKVKTEEPTATQEKEPVVKNRRKK